MKEIELTQGYTAIVDDEDYERASQYNWSFSVAGVTCHNWQAKDDSRLRLGRFILGVTDPKQHVTFVNRDCLDYRKSNLKITTRAEYMQRAAPSKKRRKTSQYKGVGRHKDRWRAYIRYQGQMRWLGVFESEEAAACAYDKVAQELYGSLAYLNFPDQSPDRLEHPIVPIRSGYRKYKGRTTVSQFKGVSYSRDRGWIMQITISGERIWRRAKSEMEAAQIYDELIIKHLGSNARSNFESIWAWKRRQNENAKSNLRQSTQGD